MFKQTRPVTPQTPAQYYAQVKPRELERAKGRIMRRMPSTAWFDHVWHEGQTYPPPLEKGYYSRSKPAAAFIQFRRDMGKPLGSATRGVAKCCQCSTYSPKYLLAGGRCLDCQLSGAPATSGLTDDEFDAIVAEERAEFERLMDQMMVQTGMSSLERLALVSVYYGPLGLGELAKQHPILEGDEREIRAIVRRAIGKIRRAGLPVPRRLRRSDFKVLKYREGKHIDLLVRSKNGTTHKWVKSRQAKIVATDEQFDKVKAFMRGASRAAKDTNDRSQTW